MRGSPGLAALWLALAASTAAAQDQQLGARTKAMGGSYTAFEDDPVSVWLNPAGISTQNTSASIAYQTYVTYPVQRERAANSPVETTSAEAETTFVDPAFIPSYLGFVFHLGAPDSGMALGICYARPYHLSYSFDQVNDPFQTQFEPDSNVDQSFARFRVALSKDFKFSDPGKAGWFKHLSAGLGVDLAYERWEFTSADTNVTDSSTALGFGAGLLLGVYDDMESFKVNLGVAFQSGVEWDFSVDPDILPAFHWPEQLNVGMTFYLLQGLPLRATVDVQFIQWSDTAVDPLMQGRQGFEDAVNFSFGVEYRIELPDKLFLYPRAGYRRFDAPWADVENLPMTSNYQLVVDTEDEAFNIVTLGAGLGWSSEDGRSRSVDVAVDFGGDSWNFAMGFNYEF